MVYTVLCTYCFIWYILVQLHIVLVDTNIDDPHSIKDHF